MDYISTRNKANKVSSARAITQGLSEEGGLFVPQSFPQVSEEELEHLTRLTYSQRAQVILQKFLTDFTDTELYRCVTAAYREQNFESAVVAPTVRLSDAMYLLELWHGPTGAFKDMALQLLPHLMTTAAQKVMDGKKLVILVATSGDTGKAALEGFRDVPNTQMIVFYPENGVSPMQKLQMATQEGANVQVCGIKGNFDDAQSAVKAIFSGTMGEALEAKNMAFSSANSINWGRLVPQIVYYFSAYCDLVAEEEIAMGDTVNVAVPTGNFGNILAAYYAKKMGLPLGKLICASNSNNVLTDFFAEGTYNRNRDFHLTLSPSMDILISSNLERLLFDLHENDDAALCKLMEQLAQEGRYTVSAQVLDKAKQHFWGGCCSDAQTQETIQKVWNKYGYLCDTHTAVALKVYEDYAAQTGDETKTILASTASPYKFPRSVLEALEGAPARQADDFAAACALANRTGCPLPAILADLQNKSIRFEAVCAKDELQDYVKKVLEL